MQIAPDGASRPPPCDEERLTSEGGARHAIHEASDSEGAPVPPAGSPSRAASPAPPPARSPSPPPSDGPPAPTAVDLSSVLIQQAASVGGLAAPVGDPPVKADANDACSIARDLAGGADEEPARAADEESTRAADLVACGSASSSDFDLDYYEALFSTG